VDAGPVDRCGDGLELPAGSAFPEGITMGDDGTLYVGTIGTGQILSYPGAAEPAQELVAMGDTFGNVIGLLFDSDRSILWACNSNLADFTGAAVVGVDPSDGSVAVRHAFPSDPGFCNDLALDADGNLYVTDTVGHRILRLPAADAMTADSLELWTDDAVLAVSAGEFGLNGIAVIDSDVYVVIFQTGAVFRIGIQGSGNAGAIEELNVDTTLMGPDGLKAFGATTLGVVQNFGGELTRLEVSGTDVTATTIQGGLDAPSTFVMDDGAGIAWVVESQIDDLLAGSAPDTPFCVRRVPVP